MSGHPQRMCRLLAGAFALAALCLPAQAQRTVLTLPTTISTAGSYILNSDYNAPINTVAITISVANVDIDLGGHSINGPGTASGSASAIFASTSLSNITISNGSIKTFGGSGVNLENAGSGGAFNSALRNLVVVLCGGDGIRLKSGRIEGCLSRQNNGTGILATIDTVMVNCVADNNGGSGINIGTAGTVQGCACANNAQHGFLVPFGTASFTGCSAAGNTLDGFNATGGIATVTGCTARGNQRDGLALGPNSLLSASSSTYNTRYGVSALDLAASGVSISNCTIGNNTDGIALGGTGCRISDCNINANGNGGISAYNTSGVLTGVVSCSITHCHIALNFHYGLAAAYSCHIVGNNFENNNFNNGSQPAGGVVVLTNGAANNISENRLNGYNAIIVPAVTGSSQPNVIYKNVAHTSTLASNPYTVGSGNDLAPVSSAAAATLPYANIWN